MVKRIIRLLNLTYFHFTKKITGKNNSFFLVKLNSHNSELKFEDSAFEKTTIHSIGSNQISIRGALLSKSVISITGNKNRLLIEKGVLLRGVTILIRGDNNLIRIGKDTTFGGARIVNVGMDNSVTIGEHCLFADNIEIWASDTHSIFDESNELINEEKPIILENKIWVGSHVKILKGVKIGEGSVIGMNTIVTKDVASHVVYAGNPPKVIKQGITWALEYKGIK